MSIRPRKVAEDKPLLLFRPEDVESVETLRRKLKNAVSTPVDKLTQQDLEILQTTEEPEKQILSIPVPRYTERQQNSGSNGYHASSSLHRATPLNFVDVAKEYDMTEEDEAWLEKFNQHRMEPLSETNFERICALIRRCACHHAKTISVTEIQKMNTLILHTAASIRELFNDSTTYMESVEALTPLLSSSSPVKSILTSDELDDADILAVKNYYLSKHSEKIQAINEKERKLKVLEEKYETMQQLRIDFERLRAVLRLIPKREQTKHAIYQMCHAECNATVDKKHAETIARAAALASITRVLETESEKEEPSSPVRNPPRKARVLKKKKKKK